MIIVGIIAFISFIATFAIIFWCKRRSSSNPDPRIDFPLVSPDSVLQSQYKTSIYTQPNNQAYLTLVCP